MRHIATSPLFFVLLWVLICIESVPAFLERDRETLLKLREGFSFYKTDTLVNWRNGTDCCFWEGVGCDPLSGRVTTLDLSNRSISGNATAFDALLNLTGLQNLNLAYNNFSNVLLPQVGFERLANLTRLNISNSEFVGEVPIQISRLKNLVSLDLSSFAVNQPLVLNGTALRMMLSGMKNLKELRLDAVNISATGTEWCRAVADAVPGLEILSLTGCSLSGPIDESLSRLRSLSVLRLDQNNLSSIVPEFFGNFLNLTELKLSFCGLYGSFPVTVFRLPRLQMIYLSNNLNLSGRLPGFPVNSSLRNLVIQMTNFTGRLPDSIGNLKSLETLSLSSCKLVGPIPLSIGNLTKLVHLDLSSNGFNGSLPSVLNLPTVVEIVLSHNYLTGLIPSWEVQGIPSLMKLDLKNNSLTGSVPESLFYLPSLQEMYLNLNQLSGSLREFPNASSSFLSTIDLSSNKLQDRIPRSIFQLTRLNVLALGSNNFSGILEMDKILPRFANLTSLDLSNNNLSIVDGVSDLSQKFPSFGTLKLVSCNLIKIPSFLKNQSSISVIDLSKNEIAGPVPSWLWSMASANLNYLNLSHNLFTDVEDPVGLSSSQITVLDLSFNKIRGQIPMPPASNSIVDYSENEFSSVIPPDIASSLTYTIFFSLSKNSVNGTIPKSICNASFLKVLDVSYNALSGPIPECLLEGGNNLAVLNLRGNQLQGTLPQNFSEECNLQTINLNNNKLGESVPRSLANCNKLEVLDLGHNEFKGPFPYWLGNITSLMVLVLGSNSFNGTLVVPPGIHERNDTFSRLQIFDLSSNSFTGNLPSHCFGHFKGMRTPSSHSRSVGFKYMQYTGQNYYQDSVSITIKGLDMTLVKILTFFTYIDFSNNRFEGTIPEIMGEFKSLYMLNLSRNALTGPIPAALGNLYQLESLDLSWNNLSGEIPQNFASLNFLSFLNLSYNNLVGMIPQGVQLGTFTNASFERNQGLCGHPLLRQCPSPPLELALVSGYHVKEPSWQFVITGLGFGAGLAMAVVPLAMKTKWRKRFNTQVDELFWALISPFLVFSYCRHAKVGDEDEGIAEEESSKRFCVFCSQLDFRNGKVLIFQKECSCPTNK